MKNSKSVGNLTKLIDQIVEMYFSGGNLYEILKVANEIREEEMKNRKKNHCSILAQQMFSNW